MALSVNLLRILSCDINSLRCRIWTLCHLHNVSDELMIFFVSIQVLDIHTCILHICIAQDDFFLSGLPISSDLFQWFLMAATLWAVYYFMEQQTMALLMVIKSSFNAALVSIFLGIVYLNLGSAMTRSIPGLPDWLYYLTYITQSRYAGAILNEQHFKPIGTSLPTLINSTLSLPCPVGTTFSNYGTYLLVFSCFH